MNTRMKCRACYYFLKRDDDHIESGDDVGQCRRYPPVLVAGLDDEQAEYLTGVSGDETDFFVQPYVSGLSWCGEFRRGAHDGPAEVAPAKKRRTRKPATSD